MLKKRRIMKESGLTIEKLFEEAGIMNVIREKI